jgi:prepilin-type N-terminal cleavage/methylation domain-containing protein
MLSKPSRAFTIIELLVVVSIIALLVGILLPAIGRARDNALMTKSQGNLKNLSTACASYAAEYKDRQVTWINDYMSRYGTGAGTPIATAFANYTAQTGATHPMLVLGSTQGGGVWEALQNANGGRFYMPFDFASKVGAFRMINTRAMNQYCNGRVYDPVFYAPKDTAVMAAVEPLFDYADEFTNVNDSLLYSSYILSPAAMFSPDVFSVNRSNNNATFTDPWTLPAGFRSPSPSQARYSDLKSNVLEHHWLQNRRRNCITQLQNGPYNGCQPPFFNGSLSSSPVTLFYDGHVGSIGQRQAIDGYFRVKQQTGRGTWVLDSPLGGGDGDFATGGYYMDYCDDYTSTSYHILTLDGIKGRDLLSGN